MLKEFFADGVSSVHWANNLIRIDFATVQPHLKAQNEQPVMEVNARVIMPLDNFLKAFELQQNIIKQLLATGLITINDVQETANNEPSEPQNQNG